MVGALSIVRFRTAVKDPIDTVYMFWSIAVGIALGAKFFLPAILASAVIGVLMLLLSGMRFRSTMPYLLVLRFNENATNNVYGLLKRLPESQLKSKTVGSAGVEMTLEIRLRESDLQLSSAFWKFPASMMPPSLAMAVTLLLKIVYLAHSGLPFLLEKGNHCCGLLQRFLYWESLFVSWCCG